MSKLSLEALKTRAEAVASDELLNTISGGLENACHDGSRGIGQFGLDYKNISTGLNQIAIQSTFTGIQSGLAF